MLKVPVRFRNRLTGEEIQTEVPWYNELRGDQYTILSIQNSARWNLPFQNANLEFINFGEPYGEEWPTGIIRESHLAWSY